MVDQSGRVAKLSDLGLARTWEPSSGIMTAETGSYRWMAPEVMMHKEYTHLCDIYSVHAHAAIAMVYLTSVVGSTALCCGN